MVNTVINALSAIGSIILPTIVFKLYRLAINPSSYLIKLDIAIYTYRDHLTMSVRPANTNTPRANG